MPYDGVADNQESTYVDFAHGQLECTIGKEKRRLIPRDLVERVEMIRNSWNSDAYNGSILGSDSQMSFYASQEMAKQTHKCSQKNREADRQNCRQNNLETWIFCFTGIRSILLNLISRF